MSLMRKLASQTAVYGIPTILGRFLNYLLVPLYTAIFIPEEYGVVTKLYALAIFINVLLSLGMETTFFRFASKQDDWRKVYATALHSVGLVALVFLGFCVLNRVSLAEMIKEGANPEYIVYFAFILFFDVTNAITLAMLRRQNRAGAFALNRSVNIFSNILLNLFFLYFCPQLLEDGHDWIKIIYNPSIGIGYIFIANLISSALCFLLLIPKMREAKGGIDIKLFRQMIVYAYPLIFVGLAGAINESFDRVLLEYLLPPETAKFDLGVYGACYKLSIVMTLFIQAFRFAAEPFFFNESREKAAPELYARITNYFSICCFIIFLLVALYLDVFKHFIRNPEYWVGLDVVPILLLANLFLGIYFNLSIWYKLADRTKIGAAISIAAGILTIILNFSLIPLIGYMGSAWATLIVYVFMCIVGYLVGQKFYPVPYMVKKFLLYLIVALFLFLLGKMADHMTALVFKHIVKAILILLFLLLAFFLEKPQRKSIKNS